MALNESTKRNNTQSVIFRPEKHETHLEVAKAAFWMDAWGGLQKQVNPHRPPY